MKKNLSESILTELDRSNIMSDQNVVDICNSFSSRNNLKYKIEGNSAVFEDGTTIKFILNDDSEIEYYFINSQGDASKTALVSDWSLLDLVTEEPMNESKDINTQFRGKAKEIAKEYATQIAIEKKRDPKRDLVDIATSVIYQLINNLSYNFDDENAYKMVNKDK